MLAVKTENVKATNELQAGIIVFKEITLIHSRRLSGKE